MLACSLFARARSVLCIGAHGDDIEIGCGGLGALLVAWLHDGSAWALSLTMVLCTLPPLVLYLLLRPWRFAAAPSAPGPSP